MATQRQRELEEAAVKYLLSEGMAKTEAEAVVAEIIRVQGHTGIRVTVLYDIARDGFGIIPSD